MVQPAGPSICPSLQGLTPNTAVTQAERMSPGTSPSGSRPSLCFGFCSKPLGTIVSDQVEIQQLAGT
jgi:hypothetical protein